MEMIPGSIKGQLLLEMSLDWQPPGPFPGSQSEQKQPGMILFPSFYAHIFLRASNCDWFVAYSIEHVTSPVQKVV